SLMSLSSILFLFLTHLGVGIALVLAWVGKDAGVKFFRFNAATAALLIAIGLTLRPDSASNHTTLHAVSLSILLIAEAALVVYWATVGRMLATIRPVLLWTAIGGGLLAVALQALEISGGAPGLFPLLTVVSRGNRPGAPPDISSACSATASRPPPIAVHNKTGRIVASIRPTVAQ